MSFERERKEMFIVTDDGEVAAVTAVSIEDEVTWLVVGEKNKRIEGAKPGEDWCEPIFSARADAAVLARAYLATEIVAAEQRVLLLKSNLAALQ
jgi:hypothetical protein